jgi:hypothetical protein
MDGLKKGGYSNREGNGKAPKVKLRRYKDGHGVWWIRLWSSDVASKFAKLLKCSGRKKSLNAKHEIKTSLSLNKDSAYRIDITGSYVYKFIKIIPKNIEYSRGSAPESPGCKRCGLGVGRT